MGVSERSHKREGGQEKACEILNKEEKACLRKSEHKSTGKPESA